MQNRELQSLLSHWDDTIGDFIYEARFSDASIFTGDKDWADRMAEHYNVEVGYGEETNR